jgi:hypothetical protein
MKKKEYKKPEMQVVNITSCALLAASTMGQGGNGDDKPEKVDDYYWGE